MFGRDDDEEQSDRDQYAPYGKRSFSKEYRKYREEEIEGEGGRYEQWASQMSDIYRFDLREFGFEDKADAIDQDLELARMHIDQEDVASLFVIPTLLMILLLIPLSFILPGVMLLFLWCAPLFWGYWVLSYPDFRSTVVKIKSSDEALRIILYMAMYLDRNPSLEGAVRTAADHSDGPLSRDMAKILWDTQTQKYTSVKQGIAENMKLWREWSPEFVKSFEFLIDSVTQNEEGRKRMLKKAQSTIIEATKSKMSQYARDLSSPVKVIHMAGIVLPLMGLIMFPMVTIFLGGNSSVGSVAFYLAFGYLIVLPAFLYFLVKRLISKRPGAYAAPSLNKVKGLPDRNTVSFPLFGQRYTANLKWLSIGIGLVIMIPGIYYFGDLFINMISRDTALELAGGQFNTSNAWQEFIAQKYEPGNLIWNVLQAMTIFWGAAAGTVTYLLGRSYKRKQIREQVEQIEQGIDVSLTELENALSKSIPIERAVYDVIQKMQEMGESTQPLYGFFSEVLNKMQGSGMNFQQAVFDENSGTIHYYPSNLLENSMRVIAKTVRRGSSALAKAVRSVNEYILNHKQVEETIKQLLDEVVGQMKILGRFIAPIITSVAASMSLLIVGILANLATTLRDNLEGQSAAGAQSMSSMMQSVSLVDSVNNAVPPTITLLVISLYMYEVALILGYFTSGIEHGFDEINMDISIAKTVIIGGTVFSIIVLLGSVFMTPFIADISS